MELPFVFGDVIYWTIIKKAGAWWSTCDGFKEAGFQNTGLAATTFNFVEFRRAKGLFCLDFWGPVSNFGIPIAAVMDTQKSPELYVSTSPTFLAGNASLAFIAD